VPEATVRERFPGALVAMGSNLGGRYRPVIVVGGGQPGLAMSRCLTAVGAGRHACPAVAAAHLELHRASPLLLVDGVAPFRPMTTPAPDESAGAVEVRAIAAERLTFFGDAVIAIALTLLALELPLPEGNTNAEVLHSAFEHRESYLAFLISFMVIGAHWRGHHQVFRYVTSIGGPVTTLTIYWLLMQVITPFATHVLTGDGAFQVRFIFYACVEITAAVLFQFIVRSVRKHHQYRADTPPDVFPHATSRTLAIAGAFLISIPVSFFTNWAYVCWALFPVAARVTDVVRRRRAAAETSAG
jgi:uncharacterized membrane protein